MLELSVGQAEALLYSDGNASPDDVWELTRIQGLTGEVVGKDAAGATLSYPLVLTKVPSVLAWYSQPLKVSSSGKYLAIFTEASSGRTVMQPLEVVGTSSSSSSTSSSSPSSSSGSATYTDKDALIKQFSEDRLIQLANDDGSDSIDEEVLNEVIRKASSEINGYLGRVYTLPLAEVPDLVRDLAADIVIYRLQLRREGLMPETVKAAYETARSTLKDIAARRVTLGVAPEPAQNTGRAAIVASGTRQFTRSSLRGF